MHTHTQFLLFVFLCSFAHTASANDVRLDLDPATASPFATCEVMDGVFKVTTSGADPYVTVKGVDTDYDNTSVHIIRFEYKAEKDGGVFECYFGPPFNGKQRLTAPLEATDTWRTVFIDLRKSAEGFTKPYSRFRLDFGNVPENRIQLRNLALAENTEQLQGLRLKPQRDKLRMSGVPAGIAPGKVPAEQPSQVTVRHQAQDADAIVATFNWHLDLDAQTKRSSEHENDLSFAPPIVAGQGEDPSNHTVIRVLSKYGQNEMQFLAYPPSVRGGVDVRAGNHPLLPGGFIAAAPLTAKGVNEVRVFTRYGGLLRSLAPPESVPAPYVLAVGEVDPNSPGDEIAITSRISAGSPQIVLVYSALGKPIKQWKLRTTSVGPSQNNLFIEAGRIGCFSSCDGTLRRIDTGGRQTEMHLTPGSQGKVIQRVFPSVHDNQVVGAFDETVTSTLVGFQGTETTDINVGTRENLFWIGPQYEAWGKRHPHIHWDEEIAYEDFPEGQYIRKGVFHHMPVTQWAIDENWKQTHSSYAEFVQALDSKLQKHLDRYEQRKPGMWEPTHSHRWDARISKHIFAETLPGSKTPKYAVLDRLNGMAAQPTYHSHNLPLLNRIANWGLRAALREIARKQRQQPDRFAGVEPVHEMEIVSPQSDGASLGDYNPEGIKGFYRFLLMHLGDLNGINKKFGTPFTDAFFDAPRDLGRGDWDAYSVENPFFMAWWRFNMHTIYRVVADGYREALLAGFGPETISAHQIPDVYAIGDVNTYAAPDMRVTPVDWIMNAGAGYGFTRYGTHYSEPHTAVSSGWTSGFGMMSLGEYAAKNPDADQSYANLVHIVDNGAYFIHHMAWDPERWPGENKAAFEACKRLVAQRDRPRSAVAGGVTKVVPFREGQQRFDVVAIGTGPDRTGLIKSVSETGDWEGTVYVVPFHSAIDIQTLVQDASLAVKQPQQLWEPVNVVRSGGQFELSFYASAPIDTTLGLQVVADGVPLRDQTIRLNVGPQTKHYRVVYKFQVDVENVTLRAASDQPVSVTSLAVHQHQEMSARLREGVFEGKRHQGGVMFDVFDKPAKEASTESKQETEGGPYETGKHANDAPKAIVEHFPQRGGQ